MATGEACLSPTNTTQPGSTTSEGVRHGFACPSRRALRILACTSCHSSCLRFLRRCDGRGGSRSGVYETPTPGVHIRPELLGPSVALASLLREFASGCVLRFAGSRPFYRMCVAERRPEVRCGGGQTLDNGRGMPLPYEYHPTRQPHGQRSYAGIRMAPTNTTQPGCPTVRGVTHGFKWPLSVGERHASPVVLSAISPVSMCRYTNKRAAGFPAALMFHLLNLPTRHSHTQALTHYLRYLLTKFSIRTSACCSPSYGVA